LEEESPISKLEEIDELPSPDLPEDEIDQIQEILPDDATDQIEEDEEENEVELSNKSVACREEI